MMDALLGNFSARKVYVDQGCPFCPLLFSMFISDLEHILRSKSSGKVKIDEQKVANWLHLLCLQMTWSF